MDGNLPTITLYKQDAKGTMRYWSICAVDYEIQIEYGVEGTSSPIEEYEEIHYGLASRTRHEQLVSRVNSRTNKKLHSGYVRDRNIAAQGIITNRIGKPHPMKAKVFKDYKKPLDLESLVYQYKYNGHRCLIQCGKDAMAYSRNGVEITTIPDIVESCRKLPNNLILDGELYHHGTALQTIGSWVKRSQEESNKLIYVVYDCISSKDFSVRFSHFSNHVEIANCPRIMVAPTLPFQTSIKKMLNDAIDVGGFEGLIARQPYYGGYEDGKRSEQLLKIKRFEDDEFLVIGIEKSERGVTVLECSMKNGKTFNVTAPGNMMEKQRIFQNRDKYIGQTVNVEYAEFTKEKKPFHPVATAFVNRHIE